MLRIELDTADLERIAAMHGYDVQLSVDTVGRLVATVRGLRFPGLRKLAARVGLGPIEVDESTGIVSVPLDVLSFAGIKLGRKLIAKKILDMLHRQKWAGVTAHPPSSLVTIDTRRLLDRALRQVEGYRVVRARFLSRRAGAMLMLVIGS